jgi:hypothetical protein
MKKLELRQLIKEEIGKMLKEFSEKEVILSNQILDFLQEREVIDSNDAQRIHGELTSFLKTKI